MAIVQGGPTGHPSAPPWYGSNPVEPIGNGSSVVVKDVIVQEKMSLESLMDAMIAKKEKEVVIVCHGWTEGLAIPVVAGSSAGSVTGNIGPLSADKRFKGRDGVDTPIIPDKLVTNQFSEARVKTLRTKMNQIRDLKMNHVAFRACNMAATPDNAMDAFRLLFGVKSLSAPKLEDSYGYFRPEFGDGIKKWVETKRKQGFRMWVDGGVAFGIRAAKTINQDQYQIASRSPDLSTFKGWVRAHVADVLSDNKVLVYHGVEDRGVADQSAPIIYFVRDRAFVNNIVYYQG